MAAETAAAAADACTAASLLHPVVDPVRRAGALALAQDLLRRRPPLPGVDTAVQTVCVDAVFLRQWQRKRDTPLFRQMQGSQADSDCVRWPRHAVLYLRQ